MSYEEIKTTDIWHTCDRESGFQGFWLHRIDHVKHGIGLNNI